MNAMRNVRCDRDRNNKVKGVIYLTRGRKKIEYRDFRNEKIRACEAMKLLNIEGKTGERFFYRLCEDGYIQRTCEGYYRLGEVLLGFFWACAEKRLTITDFLLGLSDWQVEDPEDINAVELLNLKREEIQRIHI